MRIVVTGGAGFIGRHVVARLAARGDTVVALVRDPDAAADRAGDRIQLVRSDLADRAALAGLLSGADAVLHAAGSYAVGIERAQRPRMWDANVGTAERVLGAAVDAGVRRIVYVSTVGIFGDTGGREVDEAYRRPDGAPMLSWYDETKLRAHEVAERLIAQGAPIVIMQPSQVYGPHDHSDASAQLASAHAGTLPFLAFPDAGLCWVHVDDLADGVVAALDRGRVGEAYVLAGECLRMADAVRLAARVGGVRPPRLTAPTWLLRLMAPLNDRLLPLPGAPADMAETIRTAAGVTFFASHAKAERELGFRPRSLEQGIADTWGRGARPA